VNELDVKFRHVADAQRRVAIEIRVLHLSFDELGSLIKRHAQAPEGTTFDLRKSAIWMNDRARVYDDRELFDRNGTAAAVNANAGDASDPCGHLAFLTERGGNAEPRITGHRGAPPCLFCRALEHRGLALGSAPRIGRGASIAPGAV